MYVFIFGSFFTSVFLLCLACALGFVSQQPDRCDRQASAQWCCVEWHMAWRTTGLICVNFAFPLFCALLVVDADIL